MLGVLGFIALAAAGDWELSSSSAPNGQAPASVALRRDASAEVPGWPEGTLARPELVVACERRRLSVSIDTGLLVEIYGDNFDEYLAPVALGLDAPPERTQMRRGVDGRELFFRNARKTIEDLLSAKRLTFGFTPSNAAPVETSFDLEGFDEALAPIRERCAL